VEGNHAVTVKFLDLVWRVRFRQLQAVGPSMMNGHSAWSKSPVGVEYVVDWATIEAVGDPEMWLNVSKLVTSDSYSPIRMSSSRRSGFGSSLFRGSVKILASGSGGHEISVKGLRGCASSFWAVSAALVDSAEEPSAMSNRGAGASLATVFTVVQSFSSLSANHGNE